MAELPRRILIVRLGAIGDVTNALVVARALARARPEAAIGWAVHDLARPLVEGHPCVRRVHLWARGSGLAGLRSFLREVRAQRYELAVDLQRIQKSALVARLSGAPRVAGFDRARTKELSWLWTRERAPRGDPGAHVVEQYLDVARWLSGAPVREERDLPETPAAARFAERVVAELGAAPLAVCLGASKPENRWAPERFVALVRGVRARADVPVCLVGGPGDRALFAPALEALGGAAGVLDLVGRSSLAELVALERRARAFVGCDTGPMHVAAAVGTPVVALFGPADPRRTGPRGAGHTVLVGAGRSMAGLEPEPVVEAVLRVLAAAPAGGR